LFQATARLGRSCQWLVVVTSVVPRLLRSAIHICQHPLLCNCQQVSMRATIFW
jgi:hypothetical protein